MQRVWVTREGDRRPWRRTLASLLLVWLLSVAIMAEGFPRPPISAGLAIFLIAAAIALGITLLWKRWMTIELFVYSLFPFLLLPVFDEISTSYKTPFIVACSLILTAGVVGYQHTRSTRLARGLVLLALAMMTGGMAWHAGSRFWEMASALGYAQCFPDASGCAPLTGQETPWWVLFITL